MSIQQLKQLAKLAVEDGKIGKSIQEFIMKLSRQDLKIFLSFLKNEMAKNKVTIKTAEPIDTVATELLKELFKNKNVYFEIEKALGGGIVVQDGDTIIDLSVKNYIHEIVSKVKDNL